MSRVLVKGATATLTPVVPTVTITVTTHTMDLIVSGPFATSEAKEILLEKDIDKSFSTYLTSYDNATFKGGTMKYQALAKIQNLFTLTKKKGDPVALATTTGTITCKVLTPAVESSSGTPD